MYNPEEKKEEILRTYEERSSGTLAGEDIWSFSPRSDQIAKKKAEHLPELSETLIEPDPNDANATILGLDELWSFENRLHHRRDVTLREDASQTRVNSAPEVIAALNGGILALMDFIGVKNVAK